MKEGWTMRIGERFCVFSLSLSGLSGLSGLGCNCGGADGGPCTDVDCSDHGICLQDGSSAICSCDPGYEPVGLACVPEGGDSDTDTATDTDTDTDTGSETDSCSEADVDGDGHDSEACGGEDCDDDDDGIAPGESDTVGDGTDQNCDGVDGVDVDGDGFASEGSGGDDCDDASGAANPGAADAVGDDVDQNCDGLDGVDADADGFASEASGGDDCDDAAAGSNPGAADDVCEGTDSNCDGVDGLAVENVFLDDFERADGPLGSSVYPGDPWVERTASGMVEDGTYTNASNAAARYYTDHAADDNYATTRVRFVFEVTSVDVYVGIGFGAGLPDPAAEPGLYFGVRGPPWGAQLTLHEQAALRDSVDLDPAGVYALVPNVPYYAELTVDGTSGTGTLAEDDYASEGGSLLAEVTTDVLAGTADGTQVYVDIDIVGAATHGHIDEIRVDDIGSCD